MRLSSRAPLIALAEAARSLRYLNVLLGVWLLAATWFLPGGTAAGRASDVAVGALVLALSLPRGPVRDRYAGWQRAIV